MSAETKIAGIYCPKCDTLIYSRSRHDFRTCSCKTLSVDGGFDYLKISFNPGEKYEIIDLTINHSRQELYDDWNRRIDKYGLIKNYKKKL
jgi:hypothetical protein